MPLDFVVFFFMGGGVIIFFFFWLFEMMNSFRFVPEKCLIIIYFFFYFGAGCWNVTGDFATASFQQLIVIIKYYDIEFDWNWVGFWSVNWNLIESMIERGWVGGGGRRDGVGYWTHTVGIFGWLTFDPDCGGMTESEMRMGCHFSPPCELSEMGNIGSFWSEMGEGGGGGR